MNQHTLSRRKATLIRVRQRLNALYHGHSREAIWFQSIVFLIDLATIAFFVATPLLRDNPNFLLIDYAVAVLLLLDIVGRALASRDIRRWLRQVNVWVDLFILATLLAPTWFFNLGFLRILRLWTISRSSFLWRPLRRYGLGRWEEMIRAIITLLTFLFVVTGFIYTTFAHRDAGIDGYVDALYFTVTTVTTTGFGDITLPGTSGKLVSIAVMIFGITLFVRLAQAVFRPAKVTFSCPQCGLSRHDPDAVHCKACGQVLNIPDEGD